MPAGRPKLPAELKKRRGTLNVTRDRQSQVRDKKLATLPAAILPPDAKLPVPKTLTDVYVRKFYKRLTAALTGIGVLSPVDLPSVEHLCFVLQNLRAVQEQLRTLSVTDTVYDLCLKRYTLLLLQFDKLGAKFYISPADRSKLHLEELTIKKTEQDIAKNDNAINRLLAGRT